MRKTKVMKASDRKSSNIISNLPDELINGILIRLPLRDAVRTSILSRNWRYNWTFIPHLVLDHTLWNETKKNVSIPRIKFAVILCQLLSFLEGPIIRCKVSIPDLIDCPEIDNLLYFLSRNNVECLVLDLSNGEKYNLPSSVFSCSEISELVLHHCLIKLPPTFEEFSNLFVLEVHNTSISAKALENLISRCPLLEYLELELSEPLNHIEVNAPLLRRFFFGSRINSICFKNTTHLASVQISMQDRLDQRNYFVESAICNFVEFFGSLPAATELILDDIIIKVKVAGSSIFMVIDIPYLSCPDFSFFHWKSMITGLDKIPERLPMLLRSLQKLLLDYINLTELDDVCYLLCMLKSSPYLEEITIQVLNQSGDERSSQRFLEAEFDCEIQLNHLTKVSLLSVTGSKPEIELINLLLAKSPVLEKLLIKPCKQCVFFLWINMMKQVTYFERASPRAKIIFED